MAQHGQSDLEMRMASMAIDLEEQNRSAPPSAGAARARIVAARESIDKALNCQTFIVSLFTKGRDRFERSVFILSF